jgi:hypothetical protein
VNFRTLLVSLLIFFLAFSPAHAAHLLKIGQIVPLAKTRTESFPTNFSDPSGLGPIPEASVPIPKIVNNVPQQTAGGGLTVKGQYFPGEGNVFVTVRVDNFLPVPVTTMIKVNVLPAGYDSKGQFENSKDPLASSSSEARQINYGTAGGTKTVVIPPRSAGTYQISGHLAGGPEMITTKVEVISQPVPKLINGRWENWQHGGATYESTSTHLKGCDDTTF